MELRTTTWGETSPPFIHLGVKLHPRLISPNNLTGGIHRIAEILKRSQADPAHKKNIKIVRRCWNAATGLSTGKKVLRACRVCLDLPETEESKARTKYFTFKMGGGGTLSFPAYFKEALAADSPYFKALFTNGMRESNADEIVINDVSSESFEDLMRFWLAKPYPQPIYGRPKKEQKSFDILINGISFGISPEKAEQIFCDTVLRWSYVVNFESINEIVDQILSSPSETIKKTLCQFFLDWYLMLKTENEVIKAKCESYLQQLNVSAISRQIKVELEFLDLAQKLPNTGWCVTHPSQQFKQSKWPRWYKSIPEAALELLATCPGIHSLDATKCDELTDAVLRQIAKNPHIRTLVLLECKKLTDEGVIALASSHVTHLDLSWCEKLTDKSITVLAQSLHFISLDLHACEKLTDASLFVLADNPTLTELDVGYCKKLTHKGIKALTQNASLRRLRFSYFEDDLIDEGIIDLAKGTKLTHLELYCCRNLTDKSVIALAKNPYLTHLTISDCKKLTDESLFALAKDSNLISLNVNYCDVTDEGIIAVLQNLNLKHLDIQYCKKLTSRSFDALKQHPHITFIG